MISTRRIVILVIAALWAVAPLAAEEPAAPIVPRPEKFIPREKWGSTPDPIPNSRKHTPN